MDFKDFKIEETRKGGDGQLDKKIFFVRQESNLKHKKGGRK